MAQEKKCETCAYWDEIYKDRTAGTCHFSAPIIMVDSAFIWPKTNPSDWCGKWEASEAEVKRWDNEVEKAVQRGL